MKAAVFHGAGDIRVETVPAPDGAGPGEVLLSPLWCGICGTDLHEYVQGPIVIPSAPHPLTGAHGPQTLGHEFSARVLEVGAGVTKVVPGDRVSVMPLLYCGECFHCLRGKNHLCIKMACVGLSYAWGGLAERTVVPARHVTRLPDAVTDVQGAVIEPGAVAAYGVDMAGVRPGDNVLVTGAGPIGALASLYADALGAKVWTAEVNPSRAAIVEGFGLAGVLNPREMDVAGFLRDATDGVGVDAVIECSGTEAALQTALSAVRSSGTVAQTGLHTRPAAIDPMVLSEHDITLVGTWCFPVYDWPRIIGLVERGRYPVERIVTSQVDIDRVVTDGFDTLVSAGGDQVKVLVRAGS